MKRTMMILFLVLLLTGCSSQDTMYLTAFSICNCLLTAVMACGHIISPKFFGTCKKCIEFYLSIAEHIRIRCTTFFILIKHIVHYPLPIFGT